MGVLGIGYLVVFKLWRLNCNVWERELVDWVETRWSLDGNDNLAGSRLEEEISTQIVLTPVPTKYISLKPSTSITIEIQYNQIAFKLNSITMKLRSPLLRLQRAVTCSRPSYPSIRFATSTIKPHTNRHSRAYATVSAADLSFGQPVHETHPHLLRPGEGMMATRCGMKKH